MKSMPQALLWETFSHGRWSIPVMFLLGNALPLLVYGALSGYAVNPNDPALLILQYSLLPLIVFEFAFGIVYAQGPLARLFTAPISNHALVAWRTFSGAILLGSETALAAWLYNALYQVDWPVLGPALFAASAWCAFQIILSISIEKSLLSFIFASLPCIAICLWLKSRYGAWYSMPVHPWPHVTASEFFTLLGVIAISYVLTLVCVKHVRCGEPLPTLGIWNWLINFWDSYSASRSNQRPFRSATEAQFWYEWHLKGAALPLLTLIVMILGLIGGTEAWYMDRSQVRDLYQGFLIIGGFITLLAMAVGLFLGTMYNTKPTGQRDAQLDELFDFTESMGNFLGTRPVTNSSFATAILKTAARSSLVAWCIWFTGYVMFLFLFWCLNQFPNVMQPSNLGTWYFPLTILGPWIAMANLAVVGLSGRASKITFATVGILFAGCFLMVVLKQQFSVSIAEQVFQAALIAGSVLIVIATIWAFERARQQKILGIRALVAAASASLGIALAAILLRPEGLAIIRYPLIFAFAAAVVLPFASTPLAISWNRHR